MHLVRAGFETVLEDRNVANKEKRIDTGIVTMMMRDAYKRIDPPSDVITLVAGDGDYVPTFEALRALRHRSRKSHTYPSSCCGSLGPP